MKKIFICLLIASISQSCVFLAAPITKSKATKNLTVEKNAIPPDLGRDDTYVIGLLDERRSRDKYLIKHIEENYKGKYVFSTEKDLTVKYADVNIYRYVLKYKRINNTVYNHNFRDNLPSSFSNSNNNSNTNTNVRSSNYFIYDRKEDKIYNSGFHSGMFGKVIKAYAQNMEKQRLVNLEKQK